MKDHVKNCMKESLPVSDYQYAGGCRCGSIRFIYHCTRPLSEQSGRRCQCSFCRPFDAVYVSDSEGRLEVELSDRRLLYSHLFGTSSAAFKHCARCNGVAFVSSRVDDRDYALVSARCLDAYSDLGAIDSADYTRESQQERLQRRAHIWIPVLNVRSS